jgi:hypothetical protein
VKPFHTAALVALLICSAASSEADEQKPANTVKPMKVYTYSTEKGPAPVCLYAGQPYSVGAVKDDQVCDWDRHPHQQGDPRLLAPTWQEES